MGLVHGSLYRVGGFVDWPGVSCVNGIRDLACCFVQSHHHGVPWLLHGSLGNYLMVYLSVGGGGIAFHIGIS